MAGASAPALPRSTSTSPNRVPSSNPTISAFAGLIACPQCDALWRAPMLAEGERSRCGRCGTVIARRDSRSLENALAAAVATLILLIVSLSFPFLTVERAGLSNRISVLDAVWSLWTAGMPIVTAACFLLIFAAPVLRAVLLIIVLHRARGPDPSQGFSTRLFRLARALEPWGMAEIFLIGVIVSLVKVGKLADISIGPAFWGMCGLVGALTFAQATQCTHTTWKGLRS